MYSLFELPNGLKVVLEKNDYVNSISVGLWVENGSRNENVENNGISHFIEHMLFKGTENRTSKEISESIEEVGGQLNAFTGKEATCFYIKVLDSHIDLALDVLADMLFNSKFTDEDIEKEKGVIEEEINMSEDSPEDVLSDLQSKVIWGEDPISLPILGTHHTVRSFNRAQLIKYLSTYYIPENSVISICGNIDISTIESKILKYFGKWKSKNKIITSYSSPKIQNNHLYKRKKIEQIHIGMGLYGIETGNDDIYPLLVISNILGGGASSILFQKVREELGLCYSIYCYTASYKNTGVVSIYTSMNVNSAYEAVASIRNEIEKFISKGITEDKLNKTKEQLKGNYLLGLESTSSRMFANGKSVLFLNKINKPKEIIKKIDNININDIERVMKKTFYAGIQNSAYVGDIDDCSFLLKLLK